MQNEFQPIALASYSDLPDVIAAKSHPRPFAYHIDHDPEWKLAQWHLKAGHRHAWLPRVRLPSDSMIPRAAFTPIGLALVAATLLTAFFSHLHLDTEFHDAKWIVDFHPPLPPVTAFLGAIYPFVWLLPLFTSVFAFLLHRRPQISVVQVSWFASSVTLALFTWYLLIVDAFLCVYSQHWHYIRPIGGR